MIYAKIFVEKDKDGKDVLVFDSVKDDEENYIRVAGLKQGKNGPLIVFSTSVFDYNSVAISSEAKELFRKWLNELPPESKVRCAADFEFRESGYFSFRTDAVKEALAKKRDFPVAGKCDTRRRLREGDKFRLTVGEGSYRQGLDKMIEASNNILARLDISAPRNPSVLSKQ